MKALRFRPRSLFSWNFNLAGEGHHLEICLGTFRESGTLTVDGTLFTIEKQGFLSGEWILSRRDQTVYQAHKANPFTRTVIFSGKSRKATLGAVTLGRTFRLQGNSCELEISTNHLFSRSGTVQGDWEDIRFVGFAFWITALLWRRAASASSGS